MMETERLELVGDSAVITLDEVKAHLIVDHDDDNDLISSYISAAVQFSENRLTRSVALRRHKTYGCHWPEVFELPYGPVRQIESVSYIDNDGVSQDVDAAAYQTYKRFGVDNLHFLSTPANGSTGRMDSVSVTYIAGYGEIPALNEDATNINNTAPNNIRQAVYMLCGHWYENRETVVVGTGNSPVALAAEALLLQSRVLGI